MAMIAEGEFRINKSKVQTRRLVIYFVDGSVFPGLDVILFYLRWMVCTFYHQFIPSSRDYYGQDWRRLWWSL